jgi:hypothetical protein
MIPFFAVARNKWTEAAEEVFWQMRNVEALKENTNSVSEEPEEEEEEEESRESFCIGKLTATKRPTTSEKNCAQ